MHWSYSWSVDLNLVVSKKLKERPMLSAAAATASTSSFNTNGHARVEMSTAAAPEAAAAAAGEELANGVNVGGDGGEQSQEEQKEVDIVINNVVGSFSVKCHLNLRDIALRGHNVEYRRENGVRSLSNYKLLEIRGTDVYIPPDHTF